MAKVRTISQGTPISSEVLQEHASAINEMHEQIFSQAAGVSIVQKGIAETPVRVTQGQFYGEVLAIMANATASAATPKPWNIAFNPAFADIPAVTATLVLPTEAAGSQAAQQAIVKITSISRSNVSGVIVFPKEGENVSLQLSVIAIGAASA